MKNRFGRASVLVIFISFALTTLAQQNAPKYSNEFMQLGVDARAHAMGGSMVAHVGDATAGYWNPAGLQQIKSEYQLSLMHSPYFGGLANFDFGALAMKVDDISSLGVSVLRFAVDDIADTRYLFDANGAINYDNINFFSAADYAVLVSYARQVSWLGGMSIGSNAKVIRRVVGDFANSWGFGLDVGLQKELGKWKVGLVGRDITGTFNSWSINTDELAQIYLTTGNDLYAQSLEITLPRLVIGVSRDFTLNENFDLLTSLDLIMTTDGKRNTLIKSEVLSIDPAFGFEVGYKKVGFLRGGFNQFQQIKDFDNEMSWNIQPSIGVGLNLKQLGIDYAFTDIGNQAAGLYAHVFSITVDFDAQ